MKITPPRLIAASILILLLALASPTPAAPSFVLLAPSSDSFLAKEKCLVIARLERGQETKTVEVLDNGKTAAMVPVKGNAVAVVLNLAEGSHEIVLAAPTFKRLILKVFRGKQAGYQYHVETDLAACAQCHPDAALGSYRIPGVKEGREEKLCAECHDLKIKGKYVHGPVAAGSCSPCHDPHGSPHPKFLVASGRDLCLVCHSQSMSREHVEERQNADCTGCHDPHGSAKKFHVK